MQAERIEKFNLHTGQNQVREPFVRAFNCERLYVRSIKPGDLLSLEQRIHELERAGDIPELLIEINTFGGNIVEATNLGLTMRYSHIRMMTLVPDVCHSAGMLIAGSGDRGFRYAYKDALFMLHPTSWDEYHGRTTVALDEEALKDRRFWQQRYLSSLSAVSGTPEDELAPYLQEGMHYFDVNMAVQLGFIDHVLISPKPR